MKNEYGLSLLELVISIGLILILGVGGTIGYSVISKNAKQAAVENAASTVIKSIVIKENSSYSTKNVSFQTKNIAAFRNISLSFNPQNVADEWMESAGEKNKVNVTANVDSNILTVKAVYDNDEKIKSIKTLDIDEYSDNSLEPGEENDDNNVEKIAGGSVYCTNHISKATGVVENGKIGEIDFENRITIFPKFDFKNIDEKDIFDSEYKTFKVDKEWAEKNYSDGNSGAIPSDDMLTPYNNNDFFKTVKAVEKEPEEGEVGFKDAEKLTENKLTIQGLDGFLEDSVMSKLNSSPDQEDYIVVVVKAGGKKYYTVPVKLQFNVSLAVTPRMVESDIDADFNSINSIDLTKVKTNSLAKPISSNCSLKPLSFSSQ